MQSRGSLHPDILIVGEAPSRGEASAFTSQPGQEFERMLLEARIDPERCHFTSVCKHQPPDNDIANWLYTPTQGKKEKQPQLYDRYVHPHILSGARELQQDINRFNPKLIIAAGNLPLWLLTGNEGIAAWRGSLMQTRDKGFKVIPTLSPVTILRSWTNRPFVKRDLQRCFAESQSEYYEPKPYIFTIQPTLTEAKFYLEGIHDQLQRRKIKISLDIETREGHIACIGFAISSYGAICIPFISLLSSDTIGSYWNADEAAQLVVLIYRICTHTNAQLIGQNIAYDLQYMAAFWGISPRQLYMDTMVTHHLIYPTFPKSLGFLSSLYCSQHIYWKEDSKFWDPKTVAEQQQHWRYNAMDAARTFEIAEVLDRLVDASSLRPQAQEQTEFVIEAIYAMLRGVRIDFKTRSTLTFELMEAGMALQQQIESSIWPEVYPRLPKAKPFYRSPQQLGVLLYDILGVPEVTHRVRRKRTTDDSALDTVAYREPLLARLCRRIQSYRSFSIIHNMLQSKTDLDNRMRCSYNVAGTVTFRFSSSESAFGTGTNLQTVTSGDTEEEPTQFVPIPNCRKIFIPDPGYIICDADLARADAQVVGWEANDALLKQYFREGVDLHEQNSRDLNCSRARAKNGVHATNYGVRPRKLAVVLGVTVHEAEAFIARWYAIHPGIEDWHNRIQSCINVGATIRNAFGYGIRYYDRVSENLYNEGYAWIPQSTVALVINKAWRQLSLKHPEVKVLLQVHDSLVFQIKLSDRNKLPQYLSTMNITVPYPDPLIIPVGIKWSVRSWGHVTKDGDL